MKCFNCQTDLISIFRCRNCSQILCSLQCLELHFSKYHSYNTTSEVIKKVNSPYLLQGFLNSSVNYNSFYSLDNFAPVYDANGKAQIVGSGSYGQVYLALHILNKKNYAIKHMDKKKLFSLLHSLNSIQKEIDIQSKIDHPNIVKLLYVKETHISYDLVMEYASMGSLFHYIRKYKGLSEAKAFSLFIQVVNAVNFMHSNDLIHRDIKPENILIYENNVIRLCDFGWCVKLEGHQRGTFCGTTEYMSPELVNHQGYGKEIDVWSLGILLYEMIHGYSPFRPNKPKFNEKEVMENIKNHNLIFGRTVSNECKQLIYHLLDPDINKRYSVEDIYNSEFVKKYERIHYCFPDANLIQFYNKKNIKNNEQSLNQIDQNDENININNINNIINSKYEISNSINNNVIYLDNYNYENQDFRNLYNGYNNNQKNNINYDLSREIQFDNVKNASFYEQNVMNKKYSNDINLLFDNPKNEVNNLFDNNNQNKNINKTYLENNERAPKDNEKYNKEYLNYNNNSCLVFEGILKKSSINLSTNNDNYLKREENKVIWDNLIINNASQLNNFSNQYIQINKNEINQNEIQNLPMTKNFENKSVNYNYYYNFNNYNNNFTNNFFNNNYSQISANPFPKKISISNYNINTENSNLNNSNINVIIDQNKTPSTIPTTSHENKNKSIIIKQKKISQFEIGEEKYNLSDKEQNENEHSDIKININHEQQKINNRKYLSSSDCSIFKNKKKEKLKNIFIKKLDIGEIKISNMSKINNSERIKEQKNNNSDIERVENYLLKNRIYKGKKENNYKIIANISEPNLKSNDIIDKNHIKEPNSKFSEKRKILRFLSERNINEKSEREKNIKLDKEILVNKINKEKKGYDNILRNKNVNKEHNKIIKKNDSGKGHYIGDLLCSIFNGFDSKGDQKNEINMIKEDKIYNNNTHKVLSNKISNQEKSNKTRNINYTKSNSFIKIEKNNQKLNKNSSFIRIKNKNNKVINLGMSTKENNISEPNNNNRKKMNNDTRTQPNIENQENNKNILNEKDILKYTISLNDTKNKIDDKIITNSRNKIIEIPINSQNIDLINKNKKNSNNNINLNNSKIITPKKKYIFNRIHPFKLLGAFKKELTNYTIQNSKFSIKK